MRPTLRNLAMAGLGLAALALPVQAQDKPKDIKIGITTFLSGPAAVFGEPSKAAAEMIAESLNKKGGIGGVPVTLSFVDEGAGGEALVSNYRRLVQDEKVDATFASISSGSCNQLVPLAEDLKMLNFMWDCGAASILEAKKYRYNFRTPGQRHAGNAGGAGVPAQDQAQLQDYRRRQPGLRLGPGELGDLLHRAQADEARRAGGGRVVPEVRLARLFNRGLAPDGVEARRGVHYLVGWRSGYAGAAVGPARPAGCSRHSFSPSASRRSSVSARTCRKG